LVTDHVDDRVPFPRPAARLVEVTAPDVDDGLTVEVDRDRGTGILSAFQRRREGALHFVELVGAEAVYHNRDNDDRPTRRGGPVTVTHVPTALLRAAT
jgi:hypothetical protein